MDEYDDYEGLSIHDNPYGDMDGEGDAADLWLQGQEASHSVVDDFGDISPVSPSELEGAMTAADLQLGRIGHVEPRIQAGLKALLSGQDVAGISPVDRAAAVEQFSMEIGMAPEVFANRIKIDESVQVPRHSEDLKTVVSMLQNTSGEYMVRGPGKTLPGNIFDSEKQGKADEDLTTALGYISEIADLYIDGRTRGTSVEGARRQALEESLTVRFREGVFYEGSKDLVPLPNETGVTGIISTQGIYGSPQGTAESRRSAGRFSELYQHSGGVNGQKTQYVRDERGYKVFKEGVSADKRSEVLRATPSIANSLFPKPKPVGKERYTPEERAFQSRQQAHQMDQVQFKADFARRVLREQFPTTRDESKGQINMAGWDRPTGEQEDLQNLRNEAALQGLDWASGDDLDIIGKTFKTAANESELATAGIFSSGGVGSDKSGAYGYRQLSEVDLFVEEALESRYEAAKQAALGSPKQGTQEWLNQRRGKITASTAAGLLSSSGVEQRALQLAMERQGTAEPFIGNAHTREGNEGESKAAAAFLAGPGRSLSMVEAFFESGDKRGLPGFGVSPDGRLYDAEGESAGLLELKYLASGSMKGALNKYTPQMQMQMAVTGEDQTHFYALDKFTGEYVHEIVKANPKMQAQLIEAGQEALATAAGLDARGVQALRDKIESAKARPRKSAIAEGQGDAFSKPVEEVEDITAFDPGAGAVHGIYPTGGARASDTALAKKLEQMDQTSRMKDATGAADTLKDLGKLTPTEQAAEDRRTMKAAARFAHNNQRPGPEGNEEDQQMAEYYRQAQKEAADASKEASSKLREFGDAVKESANVMSELGGLVVGGNESGMSEIRRAAKAGIDVQSLRGMRESLERGGLDEASINAVVGSAGGMVKTFNDERTAAKRFTDLMSARGASNLDSVRTMNVPGIQELQGKDAQGLTAMVQGMVNSQATREGKMQVASMFDMPELAASVTSAGELATARDDSLIEGDQRDTLQGRLKIEQRVREAKEELGELGSEAGTLGAVGVTAGAVLGSATVGFFGKKAATMLSRSAPSPKAAKMAKTLSAAGKATPLAMAATLAPMAIRNVADIKDDGSVGDSAMDVLEFAGYGAAIGSVVPGVGTVLGAGIGAVAGVAYEAYEHLSADDVMPSTGIGAMANQSKQAQRENQRTVNVTVSNEISPDLIRTTTDVDGDLNIDEESSMSTGA